MCTKACFLLKIVYVRLMVNVQRQPNFLFIHMVYLSVCAHSRSHKFSSDVFRLINGIQIFYYDTKTHKSRMTVILDCSTYIEKSFLHLQNTNAYEPIKKIQPSLFKNS